MRNALIAFAIIIAGISANLGFGPASSLASHSEAAANRVSVGRSTGGSLLPEDHPLQILYEEDQPLPSPPAPTPGPSGTVQLNLASPQLKIQGTFNVRPEEQADICKAPKRLNNPNVQFLLATVPDPVRTHLALTFDRHLESILQAAQDRDYAFSRYWLPWRAAVELESSDPEVRKKNQQEKSAREALPGLMVFRKQDGALLAVFLVGEAPTSGVDRQQFSCAANFILQLSNDPTRDFLGILGPEFSGSLALMKTMVAGSHLDVAGKIVSGSTTSRTAVKAVGSDFQTTLRNDEDAYCFLRGQFRGWARVALLSEDGTDYGSDFRPGCGEPPTPIYYPREISRLRNAYQEDPALTAAQNTQDATARRQLLLPLRDSLSGRDTLPQFSTEQTPASQETVLFQIAETIKRGRIQAAIVRGTNVLDTLFLSRFLRQCCGDLRVAVLDADLLFVHGTDSLDYLGVLAVASNPLGVEEKTHRVFGSNDAKGVYDAAKSLLAKAPYTPPPLWISVVGRGTYWPVATDSGSAAGGTPFDPRSGYPSRLWDAVFYTCSLLAALYMATYFYAVYLCHPLLRWCSDFHPSPGKPNLYRATYHLATTVFMLAAYCALAFPPAYLALVQHASAWQASGWWAIAIALGLFAMAMHTAAKYVRRTIGILLAIAAAAIVGCCVFLLYMPDPLSRRLFASQRSVELLSGTAPSLPLMTLFLALAYWAWINMQRFIFVEERYTQTLNIAAMPVGVIQRMRHLLSRPVFAGSWRRATAILLAVCLSGYLGSRWLGSLESPWFDGLFLTLLTLCGALLLLTAWAFLRVWRRLRRGLQALDLHPVRFAFAALPAVTTWSPLWQPTARRRSYTVPERVLETTLLLEATKPHYHPNLPADRQRIQNELAPLVKSFNSGLWEISVNTSRMSFLQNRLAMKLATVLEASAWRKGSSATLLRIEESQPKQVPEAVKLPDALAAEVIAIRYVALIRYVMLHLKNQLSFMTVGFILLAISLNCYAFEGEGYFRWWLTAIFLILSVTGLAVLVEMEHDSTLSRLTDTSSRKLDGSFYVKVLSAGALPLLAVVSSQFPGIGRALFSWLQPALSALH